MHYNNNRDSKIFSGIDWSMVIIYLILITLGWLAIYSAVHTEECVSIFDMSKQYGTQIVWISISLLLALLILLLNDRIFHTPAYLIYAAVMAVLALVLVAGTTIKGARSWFDIGPFRLQPSEFAKWATGLALARYMSSYNFNIRKAKDILGASAIALLPAMLIALQPDMGSAIVYTAFLIVFYREGFTPWLYLIIFVSIVLVVASFLVELWLLILLIFIALITLDGVQERRYAQNLKYLASTILIWLLVESLQHLLLEGRLALWETLLISITLSLSMLISYMVKSRSAKQLIYILLFACSTGLVSSVDYIFNNIVETHQQKRILDLLGLENDIKGWGYNVHQSKIAIGSGGFAGKGYLDGTQTKFKFVPEQSTDFIFCTIGEEAGFIGTTAIIVLFIVLIIKLIRMGENQREPFNRIYCYYVASVFTLHIVINIGMTIGLVPVIGIPLPFFSYGGSSLLAFTLLLFTAIKLNSRNNGSSISNF